MAGADPAAACRLLSGVQKTRKTGMGKGKKFGSKWRVLAHSGTRHFEMENEGVFDELVVDDWLHIEQMDTNVWWMRVGDAWINVTLSQDGQPEVDVERGFYEDPYGTTTVRKADSG
jgi:hypothetical protein